MILLNNLEQCKKEFLRANPEHGGCCEIYVEDLNLDQQAFSEVKSFLGDYDLLKTKNVYTENHIFE